MHTILKGGQWQNGTRTGDFYFKAMIHTERELNGGHSWNEDWNNMPKRWLAIMHVANYGNTVHRRRKKNEQRSRKDE